jgi:hypothetical protein
MRVLEDAVTGDISEWYPSLTGAVLFSQIPPDH